MAEPPAEQQPPPLTGVAGVLTPRGAVDIVAQLDDEQSRDLVAFLNGRLVDGLPAPAHREVVNGRWVVVLQHAGQTYCLVPLAFSVPQDVPTG